MVKFNVKRASTWATEEPLEIQSIEELLAFVQEEGSIIIEDKEDGFEILIYDDYIE